MKKKVKNKGINFGDTPSELYKQLKENTQRNTPSTNKKQNISEIFSRKNASPIRFFINNKKFLCEDDLLLKHHSTSFFVSSNHLSLD